METETQECTNCHKPFPVDRIDLHEAYCCRNIRKCKSCDKMIDIKDQEQHDVFYPLFRKNSIRKSSAPYVIR
jgi:hypothetical protein